MTGYVRDLTFTDMNISTTDGLKLDFDGRMTGLPDIGKTSIFLDLHQLRATAAGLEASVRSFAPEAELDISGMAGNAELRLRGHASGIPDDLQTDFVASLGAGYIKSDLNISDLLSGKGAVRFEGNILSHDFDLGRLLGSDLVRECSMRTGIRADIGN